MTESGILELYNSHLAQVMRRFLQRLSHHGTCKPQKNVQGLRLTEIKTK